MHVVGIVAEYNPFHTGHAYQIGESRRALEEDCAVAAVMSGHWVQGGRPAAADKWTRTRLALLGGADLVLELPTVWAASSAETFARGAVELLESTGVVSHLSFGSECGETDPLRRLAACLNSPGYEAALHRFVSEGLPLAAARQRAAEELLGPEAAGLLSSPNNNLGAEYLRALDRLGSSIAPMTVRREGAGHDSLLTGGARPPFLSATQLRAFLARGDWEAVRPYLPEGGLEILRSGWNGLPSLDRAERAVLARLRTMTAADWAEIPDSGAGEGLPPRLERAGRTCRSLEDFLALAKPKHWTSARMRRLVLWAYLGLTLADRPGTPPYLRVLGFNARGRAVLREMKTRARLPIVTKPARAGALDGPGRRLFQLEARCTDLYDLCLAAIPIPGREWTTSPVNLKQ